MKNEIKEERNLIVDIDMDAYSIEDGDEDEDDVCVSNPNERVLASDSKKQSKRECLFYT